MNVLEQIIENRYAIYNGDSCEIVKAIPDNSIHYTIFSPPFASLYTYSNSDRDMGNSKGDDEFYDHLSCKRAVPCDHAGEIIKFSLHGSATYEREGWSDRFERFPGNY